MACARTLEGCAGAQQRRVQEKGHAWRIGAGSGVWVEGVWGAEIRVGLDDRRRSTVCAPQ